MKNVYNNYALEEKLDSGAPSGNFRMDKKQTMALGREMAAKVKKINGEELNKFMDQYFNRTWEHFDVNGSEFLDCNDMTSFIKYLTSDQMADLDDLSKE